MVSFARMLKQCKVNGEALLGTQRVHAICRQVDHRWRDGKLPPATTVLGMMQQVAHRNVSCAAVRQMHDGAFTAEAFCQAKRRLPLAVLLELNKGLAEAAMHKASEAGGKWKGRHRVFLMDGSSFIVPETPELTAHVGLRRNQKPGCSDPSCHLLLQLGPGGAATAAICSPYRTGDMTHVGDSEVQNTIQPGDVVLGDRLFSNWGHLVLLGKRRAYGLFKAHHTRRIAFGRYKDHGPNRRWLARIERNDQLVQYRKPDHKPGWMSREDYEQAPQWTTVREVKVKVRINGSGQRRQVTMVTTLLDPRRYPPKDLLELLGQRWTIETDLRSLKTLMGLERVRCKTVDGVKKELAAYLLVYNVVRLVMLNAAQRQGVQVLRVSFADALAWVRFNPHDQRRDRRQKQQPDDESPMCDLRVNPHRPGRLEPRRIKKRDDYPRLHKPRAVLRQEIIRRHVAA